MPSQSTFQGIHGEGGSEQVRFRPQNDSFDDDVQTLQYNVCKLIPFSLLYWS
jgi:hypothetical protein